MIKQSEEKEEQNDSATKLTNFPMPTRFAGSQVVWSDIRELPDEMLVTICKILDDEDLVSFAKSWKRIGDTDGIVTTHNILRDRGLRCFVSKKTFEDAQLGIGVRISLQDNWDKRGSKRTIGILDSEFELLSLEAFESLEFKRSIYGVPFSNWLSVPISVRHWQSIKRKVASKLNMLSDEACIGIHKPADIIYSFMSNIIEKLIQVDNRWPVILDESQQLSLGDLAWLGMSITDKQPPKSTSKHASEKVIESFYHLYHLLLCLATENRAIVEEANTRVQNFQDGMTSKADCPNLDHLLLAAVIADVELTTQTMRAIIRETITREVVWMLDKRGAGMSDLAYLEPDAVSEYRLAMTFEAGKTAYHRLIAIDQFCNAVGRGEGADRKSLVQMRDELFARHGAPPPGVAARLARRVRAVHGIEEFFTLYNVMGAGPAPSREVMTALLRLCVVFSMALGYHREAVSQEDAKAIREDGGRVPDKWVGAGRVQSFFPKH